MFPRRLGKAVAAAAPLYVEDVFSAFTYTGNASARSIVNEIDLSTKTGLLWIKQRNTTADNFLMDTVRGRTKYLFSNSTAAEATFPTGGSDYLSAFNTNGFSLGTNAYLNASAATYVSWTFRKAAKFFDQTTKSHTNGVASTVDLSVLGTVGQVIVKRTDSTGEWYVWHRSLTAGNNLRLETTAAQSTTNAYLSVSGTTLTISSSMPTGTYVVYAWAHDTATDGIIQCGSFTTDGSGNATVSLGWEAQYVLVKRTDAAQDWRIYDTARGWGLGNDQELVANLTNAEGAVGRGNPIASGFYAGGFTGSATYIYMAIRKGLMRTPTDATKVFDIVARTGNGGETVVTTTIKSGVDLAFFKCRNSSYNPSFMDRVRGPGAWLTSSSTNAEESQPTTIKSFNQNGVTVGAGVQVNESGAGSYINYFFKQARGFFDIVGFKGTAAAHTESHNLGVVPELMIGRVRNGAAMWAVYYGAPGNYLRLDGTGAAVADATVWNNIAPTSSVFSVGSNSAVNGNAQDVIMYLFASCLGVSKIGTYTGTGAAQQIDCGFAAGARFVLIKRIDSTGDWYFWDTTRGIVSGNDPYLLLNSTAIEVTSTDYIDPYSAGFELSSTAPAALNASGGTFMFLAIA